MSEEFSVKLPKLGESIVSAVVVQWFKKEGDFVGLDEPLLEVSTDKVNSEIPSPAKGVLKKILASPDEEVQVGDMLAIIEKQGTASVTAPSQEKLLEQTSSSPQEDNKDFLSPSVLRLAAEKGISIEQLKKIPGTGSGNRVTKQDIEAWSCKKAPCSVNSEVGSNVERLKLTGMRKAIAENMVKSFYEAPHATLINEVDVTPVLQWIAHKKEEILTAHGVKVTVTSFIVQALAKALQEFPLLNSSLEQDTIVVKKYINVGIAVSIDQGLIVPVVKNCQTLSLIEIAKGIQELSQKARNSKLLPDDVLDGTISLTNFGMSGVSIGVPIIRYPEVAIVGIGAIKKQVRVLEGDVIAIRSMLHVSLTFDHRVIDGMYGCGFLASLQKHLEESCK
ncbi:MAG: 2-oxo acid dehydrogenase subunit E2 [Rhabdochlamydiaceae bacterium]|nr:2-oxo acid dehydrogenase subunit E2 [Rhabdochlamydiaceae bacterium]